jgi:hypothetical protein
MPAAGGRVSGERGDQAAADALVLGQSSTEVASGIGDLALRMTAATPSAHGCATRCRWTARCGEHNGRCVSADERSMDGAGVRSSVDDSLRCSAQSILRLLHGTYRVSLTISLLYPALLRELAARLTQDSPRLDFQKFLIPSRKPIAKRPCCGMRAPYRKRLRNRRLSKRSALVML